MPKAFQTHFENVVETLKNESPVNKAIMTAIENFTQLPSISRINILLLKQRTENLFFKEERTDETNYRLVVFFSLYLTFAEDICTSNWERTSNQIKCQC